MMTGMVGIIMMGAMGAAVLIGAVKWPFHSAASARCPVCGTKVRITDDTPKAAYKGKSYYFKSEEHEFEFLREPEKFRGKEK